MSTYVDQYVYDAENRIASINNAQYPGQSYANYVYGADGQRVWKENAQGEYTEYINFNGQPIAELTGHMVSGSPHDDYWTDYVFADGKRIAKVPQAKPIIHISGTQTQGAYGVCGTPIDVTGEASAVFNYVVQNGDVLSVDRKANQARSGVWVGLNGGRFSSNGSYLGFEDSAPDGNWHHATLDLSSAAGQTVSSFTVGPGDPNTPVGNFDAWLQNVTIQSTDGTVHPLFTGGAASGTPWGTCGNVINMAVETDPVDPTFATTFYASDHLGSVAMELSSGGWPISSTQYAPFGAELPANTFTTNHYKFTGKERDSESGLDYFGYRYFGSSMGRWTSPDPSSLGYADPTNPQSFNLYSYVLNNPLIAIDPDGLDCIYTSNLTSTSVSVETVRGDCRSDTDNGVFVNGTVNTDSYKAQVGSDGDVHLGYGFTPDDSGVSGSGGNYKMSVGSGSTDIGAAVHDSGGIYSMSQDDRIQQLAQGVTADSQHSFGCIAQAYGVGGPATTAFQLSQPVAGTKRFVSPGSSLGTSPLSDFLSKAAPMKGSFRAPVGGPGTGIPFKMTRTGNFGRAAARWTPFVALAADAYATAQLWNCLGH